MIDFREGGTTLNGCLGHVQFLGNNISPLNDVFLFKKCHESVDETTFDPNTTNETDVLIISLQYFLLLF